MKTFGYLLHIEAVFRPVLSMVAALKKRQRGLLFSFFESYVCFTSLADDIVVCGPARAILDDPDGACIPFVLGGDLRLAVRADDVP